MRFHYGLCVAVALLLSTGSALAGHRPFALTLTPFVGGYRFEGNENLKVDAPQAGLAIGYNFGWNFALEGVGSWVPTHTDDAADAKVNVYSGRLDLIYHLLPKSRLVPYVSAGGGLVGLRTTTDIDTNLLGNYGVGVKYFLSDNVALRLAAQHAFDIEARNSRKLDGDYYNNLSYTVGLTFQAGGEKLAQLVNDADMDGIVDAYDRSPETPAGVAVDGSGVPLDSDRDGIFDTYDRCPDTLKGVKVDAGGCEPVVMAVAKPVTAGVGKAGDGDGDGVADAEDRCPNTPPGAPVNDYGCLRDSDVDGVFDIDDQCSDTPRNLPVDDRGCPLTDDSRLGVETYRPAGAGPAMLLRLEFSPGKAEILREHHIPLSRVADFIKGHPDQHYVIEGHTDSVGPEQGNQKLSLKRAESIRDYLVSKLGVPRSRLSVQGYGEMQPIGDNATQLGRLLNRRVVIMPVVAP